MRNIFDLDSVAIIGASNSRQKLGYQLTNNLIKQGFKGRIYPVNLEEKKILGLTAYHSVLDVHGRIDLAVIIIPREGVPGVLKQCILKEIPYVLIITAGFAEKDALGKKLQKELVEITKNTKTKIIGPNCLGLVNTQQKINLTFAAADILTGNVSLILQSGAIGAAIFDWAKENQIGISKFISLGNKISISEIEAIEFLQKDPDTQIIAIYLEEFTYPEKLMYLLKQVTCSKPVIFLKGGTTRQGALAASSHTAALATKEKFTLALAEQANVIFAENFGELLHFVEIFSSKHIEFTKNNLAIITNAGGPGILAADSADRSGFKLPSLDSYDKHQLSELLGGFASLNNPIDLGGDAQAVGYHKTINFLINNKKYDALVIIVTPQTMTEIKKTAEVISEFRNHKKPLAVAFLGGERIKPALKILHQNHIPNYEDPNMAIELLGKIFSYQKNKLNETDIINFETTINQTKLNDEEIIRMYQLPFTQTLYVNSDAEVMGTVEKIGFPLVYKTAKKIIHKGKAKKVGLNISNQEGLQRAIQSIGFPGMIQPMIDSPFEVIVGANRDQEFGVVIIFGQGGIFTEESRDVKIKMMPLTDRDIDEMIEETKIWPAIEQFQIKSAIKETIKKIAKIMLENADIKEIELNPVKILKNKIVAVDINTVRKND